MRSNAVNQLYLPSSKKIFYVWSYYRVLHSNTQLSFPCNTIWKPKVPIKVSFFLWSAALERILTVDNLRILTGVVDLLASWPSKFNKHRSAAILAMIPHCLVGYLAGTECKHLKEMRDQSITWSYFSSKLYLGGQMPQGLLLLFLKLICLIDVIFMFCSSVFCWSLAHCLCALVLCVTLSFLQWSFIYLF